MAKYYYKCCVCKKSCKRKPNFIGTVICNICKKDIEDDREIYHIKPLSSFDLTNEKQLAEACHYTNMQPLWYFENIRKGGVRKNQLFG